MADNLLNNKNNNTIEDKFIASLILYSLGDTIGFKNGIWASKYNKKVVTLNVIHELLYEFIYLGGINGINLDGWTVSINTLGMMATAYSLLESDNYIEEMRKIYKGLIYYVGQEATKEKIFRGLTPYLYDTLVKLEEKDIDQSKEPFDIHSIDNSCSIRTLPIGLAFHGEPNRSKLIDLSINCGLITNNSPIGFLGGLTTALFGALSIEKKNINEWPFILLDILKSESVSKYINDETEYHYDKFIQNWEKYIDLKFKGDEIIKIKSNTNILYRSKFYYDNFTDDKTSFSIGHSGYSSVIMAYDCLVDCSGNWEKLIIYSALHFGDTHSVAAITGGLYGAYYGWGDVPNNNLKYLEFRETIYELSKNLYKRYIAKS